MIHRCLVAHGGQPKSTPLFNRKLLLIANKDVAKETGGALYLPWLRKFVLLPSGSLLDKYFFP
jgi:hypothetical protein